MLVIKRATKFWADCSFLGALAYTSQKTVAVIHVAANESVYERLNCVWRQQRDPTFSCESTMKPRSDTVVENGQQHERVYSMAYFIIIIISLLAHV